MPKHNALSSPDQFDSNHLALDEPEKIDGKRVAAVSWKDQPLYLQTPRLKVASADADSVTVSVPEGPFRTLLAVIEDSLLKKVAERSGDFFGRAFPLENVVQRHVPLLRDDPAMRLPVDPSAIVRNQYGAEKTLSDLAPGADASFFIHVQGVTFGRRSSEIAVGGLQVKIHMDPRPQEWQMEETVTAPNVIEEEISEEISDAKPLNDNYYNDELDV